MPSPRTLAILLISLGLCLLALSHYHYGLAEQRGLLIGIVPLLFAGLLLGRVGLWATATALFAILLIGAWTDQRLGVAGATGWGQTAADLLQPLLGSLIVALILDRLILKSEIGRRRSHDLALLCRQLDIEMQERERSQAQLVHSQRMDALGKLAGNVAHDFNNLLSVILGYATQHDDDDPDVAARMAGIAAATQRGKQMTDKLMTLARATPSVRQPFDANAILEELLPMLRSMLGRRIEVVMVASRQPAWLWMDLAEFEACVLNIAKNAGDAMAGEGVFRIETTVSGGEVRLRFADDGCGMPPEVAACVFDPFFTTKPAHQGTGIGLSVVYRAITESGGRIEVDSVPGAGARFTVHLPLHDARAVAAMPTD